jgi:hypothetical protein
MALRGARSARIITVFHRTPRTDPLLQGIREANIKVKKVKKDDRPPDVS